jgi:hypothetical protein
VVDFMAQRRSKMPILTSLTSRGGRFTIGRREKNETSPEETP